MARRHCLLRDLQNRIGAQHAEISASRRDQDVGARGLGHLILRLGPQFGGSDQTARSPEIGDKLVDQQTRGEAVVDHRIVERAGRQTAS